MTGRHTSARLEAAGAEVSRVHIVDDVTIGYAGDGSRTSRGFSLQADIQKLGSKLDELRDVAVVVIDPISAYLGDNRFPQERRSSEPSRAIERTSRTHDTAIIGVSHLNKGGGAQALMRVTGSWRLLRRHARLTS